MLMQNRQPENTMALDPTDQAMVDKLEAKVAPLLAEVAKLRGFINTVYELAGEPVPYADAAAAGAVTPPAGRRKTYARDAFYGKGLATAVRQLIEDNGALSADEIRELLFGGGFKFDVDDPTKQVNNLKISLGKNQAFDKTSKGDYTIAVQRGKRKAAGGRNGVSADAVPAGTAAAEGEDEADLYS